MSITTMYGITKDGLVSKTLGEYQNSWLGSFTIWNIAAKRYTKLDGFSCGINDKEMEKFWDCWKNSNMLEWFKIVILTTYDNVWVRRENWDRLITALLLFANNYSSGTRCFEYVNTLNETRCSLSHNDVMGCCWQGTSVADDLWYDENDYDPDQPQPYNLNTGTKHWELFDDCLDPWLISQVQTGTYSPTGF